MIVIENDNHISNWLDGMQIDEIGFAKIDIDTFEIAKGFETELVIIEDIIYHQLSSILKDKINNVGGVIVFNSTGSELQFFLEKVIGVLSPDTPASLVRNQIVFLEEQFKNSTVLKSQLMTLNQELINTIGGVESQLLRVKKVYEQTTPKRLENFKGFIVYSKYAAGEDLGGEFFDLFAKDGKVFVLMSATSSFLVSSSILEIFTDLKMEGEISKASEARLIQSIKDEVVKVNLNKKKPVDTQILTFILDMSTLKLSGHSFGQFQLVSTSDNHSIGSNTQLEGDLQNAHFELQLERGERILFNSPGFVQNWDENKTGVKIKEIIKQKDIKPLDVLDEIYFQLKKKSENGFLPFDASSIIMEVQENVMVKM